MDVDHAAVGTCEVRETDLGAAGQSRLTYTGLPDGSREVTSNSSLFDQGGAVRRNVFVGGPAYPGVIGLWRDEEVDG